MNKSEIILTSSQEDYLEAIYLITKKHKVARNKDIAENLNVKRATVTGAIKILAEKKLINYESHAYITLTDEGEAIAKNLIERHNVFTHFFKSILGLDDTTAEKVACEIEHTIKGDTFERFKLLIKNIESCRSPEKFDCSASLNRSKQE